MEYPLDIDSLKNESLSMSFHHIDFDFSNPDNDIKTIDDLFIDIFLLMFPEIKVSNNVTANGRFSNGS